MRAILHFSAAISIEFKKGELSYKQKKSLDDMRSIGEVLMGRQLKEMFADHNRSSNPSHGPSAPPNYRDQFLAKYYSEQEYQYYPALYDFITGGNSLDADELLDQLKKNFDDRVYKPSEQEEIYSRLCDPQVLDLTDREYIELTDKMLRYACAGDYPLDRYLSILFYTTRHPDNIRYELAETVEQLVAGILANAHKFKYIDHLSHSFGIDKNNPDYEFYLSLHRALNDVNNGINKARIANIRADTLKEFIETPEEFYKKAQSFYDYDMPMLAYWNFDQFFEHFKSLPTSAVRRFRKFLKSRFGEILINEKLEYYFIEKLFNEVAKADPAASTIRVQEIGSLALLLKDIITRNYAVKNIK